MMIFLNNLTSKQQFCIEYIISLFLMLGSLVIVWKLASIGEKNDLLSK